MDTIPEPVAVWVRAAVLVELLPVAVLMPVLAMPRPMLPVPPSWVAKAGPSASASWPREVEDRLPMAWALPVPMAAVPREVSAALPPLLATCGPLRAGIDVMNEFWVRLTVLVELLPKAWFWPVLALA